MVPRPQPTREVGAVLEKDLAQKLAGVAIRRGGRGFTFEDLTRASFTSGARIGDVADWLAQARSVGFVEDLGFDWGIEDSTPGPRRYRLGHRRLTRAG
jgi:hypothetical protein